MTTFLKPLFTSLKQLKNGVEINSPDRGTFILKGALIACTCDLPARAIITNTIQYNGAFCCVKCLQRGQTAKTGEKGSTHVFSFNSDDPKGLTRTEESVLENSKDALQLRKNGSKQQHVNGIKGRSWFMSLSCFHLVDGIAIDYMHSILLGIQKKLLTLWFSPQYKSKSYNVSLIDKRLLATRPPSVINRMPRNVSDSLKYWKASEFRSFLLFYGVPLLCGILPSIYLQHYILLAHGIFILLKDNITENDLVAAESCLLEFVWKFERLYDLKFETLNFHQLVHLVDQVHNLGGVWTHACFTFEDKIRVILKFIHGPQCIDCQIVTAVSFTQKIPELIADYVNEESGAKPLKEQLTSGYLPKIQERIIDGIYRLGTMISCKIFEDEFEAVTSCLGFPPLSMNCQSFTRIIFKNKILVYGTDHHRLIRRDNSVVKIIDVSETVAFFQI